MFIEYLKLGLEHILDPQGIDHVLFLVALVIIFTIKDWKVVILMSTAFTIGHSITLALAALKIVSFPSNIIEIFIATSIAVTALANIIKPDHIGSLRLRYLSTILFGLVHGLGFAGFFRTILGKDNITLPLVGFNIGVELAQIIVVILVLLLSYILTTFLKLKKKHLVIGTSLIILIYSLKLVVERI